MTMRVRTSLPSSSALTAGSLFAAASALLWLGFPVRSAAAQQTSAVTSSGWTTASPFRPLDLPAPNRIRTGSGRPGPDYWQQKVDYAISASIDVGTHVLAGSETVHYENHSPETLTYVWMQLDGNICSPQSVNATLHQPPLVFGSGVLDFSCRGGSGVKLERVEVAGVPAEHHVAGTMMRIDLPAPLVPGGAIELGLAWSWTIPKYGDGRMGRDGTLYEIAQWYPRMAVFDDLAGWNTDPFIGGGEFYLEYGDFEVRLTVPAGYLVAATGSLQNPKEVLTAAQRERLARARTSSSAVAIVTRDEAVAAGRAHPRGTRTWRFSAHNVRDFAFAMAPNFRWDASDWDGILIETLYRPEATPWEEANRMARETIHYFSERVARYPWSHATTVEGPIEGMEYPMLTFVPSYESREQLFWVLTHEFGHEWFPMLVGSNERLHPWMDEGFNTFIDLGSIHSYFSGEPYGDTISVHPLHMYRLHALPGTEQPMNLRPVEQHDLFWAAYQKPALMLHLLRTEILGKPRFDRAFHLYTQAWSFKHPSPADFFRFMEDAAGMDLDWFWREWITSTARLDQAIASVQQSPGAPAVIRLQNLGQMVMPVELRLEYADGSHETVRLPIDMWNLGPDFQFTPANSARLVSARLDPRGVYPDTDRSNDRWPSAASK